MRKFLYILGSLTLVVMMLIGAGIGFVAYKGHGLDQESKAFVDSAIPAIASNWSSDALLSRATPELKTNTNASQLTQLFDTLSRLGPMVEYDGAKGQANMSYFTGSGTLVSASYVANAKFQNGTATFQLYLLKRDGHWLIHNFHVDPNIGVSPQQGT